MFFQSRERTDWRVSQPAESNFRFLDRSSWPICEIVRNLYNDAYQHFEGDPEFLSRFKSAEFKQYSAAMMELLFFQINLKYGLQIERLSRVAGTKTPDFKVTLNDSSFVFVETTLSADAMTVDSEQRRIETVLNTIEGKQNFGFYVFLHCTQTSGQSIPKKTLFQFLDEMAAEYNDEAPVSAEKTFNSEGWIMEFRLIKKDPTKISTTNLAGTYYGAKWVNNFKPLFAALNGKKASRYQLGEVPYIVSVGVDDLTARENEFCEALFGPNNPDEVYLDQGNEGFFWRKNGPVNTSVSAVIFCKWIKEYQLDETQIAIWHNPFAKHALPIDVFPFDQFTFVLDGNKLIRKVINNTINILSTLGIDKDTYKKYKQFQYKRNPNDEVE